MTRKAEMIAALTKAQEAITHALAALELADDDGFGPAVSDDFPIPTQDAQIYARDAYHALRVVAWPPSADPLDAIERSPEFLAHVDANDNGY